MVWGGLLLLATGIGASLLLFPHRSSKDAARAAYDRGVEFNKQQRIDEAREQFAEAVMLNPDVHQYHQAFFLTNLALRRGPQAIAFYQELVRKQPGSAVVHYWLGRLHLQGQSLDEAAREFEEAGRLAPKDEHAWISLGHVYLRMGQDEKALVAYRRANELAPRVAVVHAGLGTIHFNRNEFEQAEAEFNEALLLDPSLTEARYNLSLIYEQRKEIAKAVTQWQLLLEQDPNESKARERLARTYLAGGRYEDAVREYTLLSGVRQSSPEVFVALGEAQVLYAATLADRDQQRRLREAAIEAFQRTLELDPGNAQARRYLDRLAGDTPPRTSP
jgi:tetratricopeptide (TPR) repeat protein